MIVFFTLLLASLKPMLVLAIIYYLTGALVSAHTTLDQPNLCNCGPAPGSCGSEPLNYDCGQCNNEPGAMAGNTSCLQIDNGNVLYCGAGE